MPAYCSISAYKITNKEIDGALECYKDHVLDLLPPAPKPPPASEANAEFIERDCNSYDPEGDTKA